MQEFSSVGKFHVSPSTACNPRRTVVCGCTPLRRRAVYSAEHPLQFRAWRGSSILQWESLGPNAQLGIENERLDRYGYARQDFANLNRRVRLMQVAHGARENSRHTGTAAPRSEER